MIKLVSDQDEPKHQVDIAKLRLDLEKILKVVDDAGLLAIAARLSHAIDSLDEYD